MCRCVMAFSTARLRSPNLSMRYRVNEVRTRASEVMYTSLVVGREKSVRCGSLCYERTRLALISVTTESSWSQGGLSAVFDPDQCVR